MAQLVWLTNSLGGFLSNPKLSDTIRHASSPMYGFRQFASYRDDAQEKAVGAHKGATILYDKLSRINTRGGTLVETNTVPSNNFTITQGSCVMTEYGGTFLAVLKSPLIFWKLSFGLQYV